jgi:hypothetical protein
MIVSYSKKILVATPTKVGSESLEKDIIKTYEVGERLKGISKHATNCDLVGFRRLLLVRHPLERFSSIYHFIGKSKGNVTDTSGLFHAARKQDINLFCERFIEAKKTVWTLQLHEYYNRFNPKKVYKLEQQGLNKILKEFGVTESPTHINKTAHNGFTELSKSMRVSVKNQIVNLHKQSVRAYELW